MPIFSGPFGTQSQAKKAEEKSVPSTKGMASQAAEKLGFVSGTTLVVPYKATNMRALAPEVTSFPAYSEFFRSLFSRAINYLRARRFLLRYAFRHK
jgi:hypothetical protein